MSLLMEALRKAEQGEPQVVPPRVAGHEGNSRNGKAHPKQTPLAAQSISMGWGVTIVMLIVGVGVAVAYMFDNKPVGQAWPDGLTETSRSVSPLNAKDAPEHKVPTDPVLETTRGDIKAGSNLATQARKPAAIDADMASARTGLLVARQLLIDQAARSDIVFKKSEIQGGPETARGSIDVDDAGAISKHSRIRDGALESRLKFLLAEQPNSLPLKFALGNLYVIEHRWAEAQQTFFEAHSVDPDNPDIAYNLAISLDHLHQPRLASKYYTLALSQSERSPSGFDRVSAQARLKALESLPVE